MNQFERTLKIFVDSEINFVVIGGAAIAAHGSAHATFDLDICYERSRENILRLVKALEPVHPSPRGAPPGLPFRLDAATVTRGLNFTLLTDLGDLDLIGEVAGIGFYKEAAAQSEIMDFYGKSCRILTLDGLIASKRAAGRTRDLLILPELEALREIEDLRAKKRKDAK